MGRSFLRIALVFLATRALLVVATFVPWPLPPCTEYEVRAADGTVLEVVKVPWHVYKDAEWLPGERDWLYAIHPPACLDSFARMDSSYYLSIAAVGYAPIPGEPAIPQRAGFFPGYPVAVAGAAHAINAVLGRPGAPVHLHPMAGLLAAFLVSNCALLLAAFALFRVAHMFLEEPVAEGAAIALLVSPVSFFGSAYLAESLFLAFSISCLLFAFKRRMGWAAILGCAAAFTRPVGVLLVVPLLMISVRARADSRQVVRDCLLLLLVPVGALAMLVWHSRALGDPLAYFAVQDAYGHGDFPDFAGILDLLRIGAKNELSLIRDGIQVAAVALAAVGCVPLFSRRDRKLPLALGVWAVLAIAFALLSGHLLSMPRYVFSAFPVFIGAAMLVPRGRWATILAAFSVALQVAGFVVFMRAWPVLV